MCESRFGFVFGIEGDSSLPASLAHYVPSEQKIVHRLIYKSLSPTDQTSNAGKSASQSNVITFEVVIAVNGQASDAESVQTLSIDPRWQKGTETVLDLMMPDRSANYPFILMARVTD